MQTIFTDTFFSFLESNHITPKDAADALGKKTQTVYNWKTKGIPKAQILSCQAFIDKRSSNVTVTNSITMEPTREQFNRWNKCALAKKMLIEEWAMQSLNEMADLEDSYKSPLTSSTLPENIIELPYLGAVAAGEPVSAPLNDTLPVSKEYPEKHFIVEVNGRSAEPDFPDGSRWVVDGRDKYTPKNGAVCVVSDEYGSYIKRWNGKKNIYESINPEFNDVMPGESAKLQGYPVEMVE